MRMGAFPATDFRFGIPTAILKPANNNYPLFDQALLDLNLSNEDLQDLQQRTNALTDALRGSQQGNH